MSAGEFSISKYETNNGDVVPIRVQPETLALTIGAATNDAPAGDVQTGWPSANATANRRQNGINVRYVRLKWSAGAPTDYAANSVLVVPILTKAMWDGIARGQTGTYLGSGVTVATKINEKIN
jgi:hypothetical protein